jgi:hypothetical protein
MEPAEREEEREGRGGEGRERREARGGRGERRERGEGRGEKGERGEEREGRRKGSDGEGVLLPPSLRIIVALPSFSLPRFSSLLPLLFSSIFLFPLASFPPFW